MRYKGLYTFDIDTHKYVPISSIKEIWITKEQEDDGEIGEERMKSKEKLSDIAPIGQVWVCGACGKYNSNRYNVGDVSCYINAVLCHDDETLKIKDGRVVSARAIKEKEND